MGRIKSKKEKKEKQRIFNNLNTFLYLKNN